MNRFVRTAVLLLASICGITAASIVYAQGDPAKVARIIVAIPAGSIQDVTARAIANSLAPVLGQAIIIENKVGANGTIGMEACFRAAPDGNSLCIADGNFMTINPFAYAKLPYDPRAFVPIIHLGDFEQCIAVHASVPVKSMGELIDLAKAKPGQVTWGSGGPGSTMHLYLEWIQAKTGARFNHIPYKGPPDLVRALASGEVAATAHSTSSVAPFVRDGKVRMISVTTGQKRSQFAGDTPSFAEQGYDLDFRNWVALWFPKGTPNEIVRRWNAEVNKLLADRNFVEKVMAAQALTPAGGTPEDLAALLERKLKLGAELVGIANLRYD